MVLFLGVQRKSNGLMCFRAHDDDLLFPCCNTSAQLFTGSIFSIAAVVRRQIETFRQVLDISLTL